MLLFFNSHISSGCSAQSILMKNALGSLSGTERVRENHHISGKEGDAFRSCSVEGGPPLSTLPVDVWCVCVCVKEKNGTYILTASLLQDP